MAAADPSGHGPDHYQLLGVPLQASRQEITQAWRRRARAEHPDSRPADAAAAGRFRALAEAYQVLADPARRADYDRARTRVQQPAARASAPRVPVRWPAGPPLQVGPVRVNGAPSAPAAGLPDEGELALAVLAQLALRCLARDRDWPW
jgi:curved DNA-binding protein CbpA